ncbi:DUF4129 domain-containing protein [Paenibacillus cremeus]|uniref:DUF4129 domain-containing protein n=1 Tax=Paenibacillus cremeus TaxID=2163881 RepID=A0A559KE95_9BACL|nr:DUF4129 domain-containing protein [Paenibacillus cremeus]TVY10452.1 DUF4129 domain-containing protein [Paenibacillus cremeus]
MKAYAAALGLAVAKGLVELLLFFPALFLVILYALPSEPPMLRWLWFAALPLCYAVGYAVGGISVLHQKYRLHGCLIALAFGWTFLFFGSSYVLIYGWLFVWLLTYRGSQMTRMAWQDYFPGSFYLLGMILYFATSVVTRIVPTFTAAEYAALTWCGIAALAVTLLMVNQGNLRKETLSSKKDVVLASTVVLQNRILISIVFAAILVFALYRQLEEAVIWLKDQLILALLWVLSLFDQPSGPTQSDQPAPPPPMGQEPPGEAAWWWVLLEKAALIFAYVVAAVMIVFLLYQLIRVLARWIRRAISWLRAYLEEGGLRDSGTGYQDDVESLVDWEELRDGLAARFRRFFQGGSGKEPGWHELKDNRERVRFLYRAMLETGVKAGYRVKPHLTPKETGRELEQWEQSQRKAEAEPRAIVPLYEQVRYGDRDVSDADVAEAKRKLEAGGRKLT